MDEVQRHYIGPSQSYVELCQTNACPPFRGYAVLHPLLIHAVRIESQHPAPLLRTTTTGLVNCSPKAQTVMSTCRKRMPSVGIVTIFRMICYFSPAASAGYLQVKGGRVICWFSATHGFVFWNTSMTCTCSHADLCTARSILCTCEHRDTDSDVFGGPFQPSSCAI